MKLSIMILAAAAILSASGPALSAPEATVALDVCHNTVTGNYLYSGVVAVRGASSTAGVSATYKVQNQQNADGYVDALALPAPDAAFNSSESSARVLTYAAEAAPLTLGTLRSTAGIIVVEGLNAPIVLQASYELMGAVCGCQIHGCTRTQGYWGSKPGVTWPAGFSRDAMFFSSGLTWQQIMDTPPAGGNGYIILAHQYIAARLNIAAGASAPSSIQNIIGKASAWFASGATLSSCGGAACGTQKTWAGMLDTYNNGLYPGAPKHCPD